MRAFQATFEINDTTRILDVGGRASLWGLVSFIPSLAIVNTKLPEPADHAMNVPWVQGDGCELPFPDQSFDIVFSNSVIEHLGDWDSQLQMAREISRVGRGYYVQTPNRGFPIEPHLIAPFIHYLPKRVQRRLIRHGTIWGLMTKPTPASVETFLEEVRLLNHAEMRVLFPDAQILQEKMLGLTKSLIAIRKRAVSRES